MSDSTSSARTDRADRVAQTLRIRATELAWGARTYVMAILNATPDSFSGDGLAARPAALLERAAEAVAAGADILDIGGESTRPGAEPVDAGTEIARVLPVLQAVRDRFPAIPISIDTSKAAVAEAALAAGADMVNDVWGLRADPELAGLVATRAVPVVLMHNRSTPAAVAVAERVGAFYRDVAYGDLLAEVGAELLRSVAIARAAGIPEDHIILDAGLGFGKSPAQSLELLDRTDAIRALGYPVLVGPSRKSFVGLTLGLPPEERLEGTAAAVAVAIARGADIVRVHDVRAMVRVARMTDAIVRRGGREQAARERAGNTGPGTV